MPKHKPGVVLETYEGTNVDCTTVTGATLREGLHAFQSGKKLRAIIQQYFTIQFPPRTLPTPATRPSRCRLDQLTTSTWEEDCSGHPAASPPRRRSSTRPVAPSSATQTTPTPTPREEAEEQSTSPQPKRRRLDRKNGKVLAKDTIQPVVMLISESHAQ